MTTTEKREATKNTQTTSGDFYTVCGHITNSRSLLDLAAEYILNGQDATAEEKLYNILFAVETARDEASTPPPEKLEGAEGVIRGLYVPLWEAWSDALIVSGATETTPLTLMFLGFCGATIWGAC